ncbi:MULTISPECIES: CsbD family protein [unclassified Streptomyces]|uniref:CsbD family protein n=1 Tax=unclassified Streptomyces TaxID=2593676 RepID=UPI0033A6506E
MSGEQKMKAKGEQTKGKAEEAAGRVTGNERLKGKGKADQAKGEARSAKEKAKDVFKH